MLKHLKTKAKDIGKDVQLILNDIVNLVAHAGKLCADVLIFWKSLSNYKFNRKLSRLTKKLR